MEEVMAKSIISPYKQWGWFGSNYNMNIYRGCCHGCIYCDSRSECYHIEQFDTVKKKKNSLELIDSELKSKRKGGIIITGSMSDAYNPFEEKEFLTRNALKLIYKHGFGICIDTKSDLVCRDMDVLLKIKQFAPAVVNFTITTADDNLCKALERNVAVSSRRLKAMKYLSSNGIVCGTLLMPILPFINDTTENIKNIVRMSALSGAKWIYSGADEFGFGVTLRQNQRDYYYMWLDKLFPHIKERYIDTFSDSYNCTSNHSQELTECFIYECKKHDLLYKMEDIISYIQGLYKHEQLTLF